MTKWDEHDPLYDDINLSENEEIKTSIKKVKGEKISKEKILELQKKGKVICPECGKETELILVHYYIRTAIFYCSNCEKYYEKYFEIKGEK